MTLSHKTTEKLMKSKAHFYKISKHDKHIVTITNIIFQRVITTDPIDNKRIIKIL